MNYYKILQVKRNATMSEIKEAYKKLAKTHHPDVTQSRRKLKKFDKVSEAYDILSNYKKRWIYDHTGKVDSTLESDFDENDLQAVYG